MRPEAGLPCEGGVSELQLNERESQTVSLFRPAGVEARIRSADGAASSTVTPAEVAFCIEAVARQVWRLEATKPAAEEPDEDPA